jgi:hypothetical protein
VRLGYTLNFRPHATFGQPVTRRARTTALQRVWVTRLKRTSTALIRMRLLKEDQRQDVEALQTAVLGLLYRAEDDLA